MLRDRCNAVKDTRQFERNRKLRRCLLKHTHTPRSKEQRGLGSCVVWRPLFQGHSLAEVQQAGRLCAAHQEA